MIGVVAAKQDHSVVREFFELFKTPWELYRAGANYDVILCCGEADFDPAAAKLVVVYSGRELRLDEENQVKVSPLAKAQLAMFDGFRVPIYGTGVVFRKAGQSICRLHDGRKNVVRVGYSLPDEVRFLLTEGQPTANAGLPTLELHIAILRKIIIDTCNSLLEIPAVPAGYQFIVCLTHDVDHPSMRRHVFDRTVVGFLFRAVIGSALDAIKGRIPAAHVFANWWAALKLPFVQLGLARDFWADLEHYAELEQGSRSTFFVIPFKRHPGVTRSGLAPSIRGAAYGATDIAPTLRTLTVAGCEIGLHGLDAWAESTKGRREAAELKRVIGNETNHAIGVRMHWLYFDQHSPAALEQAGFAYDSTVGYNETIGFRAGTTQVYRHLHTESLLELPLHVMDTALFYPSHLHLTFVEAHERINQTIEQVAQLGGCITFNWHDRSIAPERLWARTYVDALNECRARGAWITAAGDVVEWFRRRRAVNLEGFCSDEAALTQLLRNSRSDDFPGMALQVHHSPRSQRLEQSQDSAVSV